MVDAADSVSAKVMWLGHAGFKIVVSHNGEEKVNYIDPWFGNPKYPDALKAADGSAPIPTDADLILITHGHWDHSQHAPDLQKASTKEGCKILAAYELCMFF